ncbi:hypothetical protein [Streptomyces cinerochromogenes]|uniref:hypothetical protein n=1 Tax=Streptomyces cinerochromogenes TaxID=66422 RepID=UPI0033A0389E
MPLTPDEPYTAAMLGVRAVMGVLAAGAGLATARTLAGRRRAATTVSLCAAVLAFLCRAASLSAHFVTLVSGSGVESAPGWPMSCCTRWARAC